MKNIIIVLLIVFITNNNSVYGQKIYNNWVFGKRCGVAFKSQENIEKFNTSIIGNSLFSATYIQTEGSCSISDSLGKLLFYTNGEAVWNKENQIMPNGWNFGSVYTCTQSSLIVRHPKYSYLYYVFITPSTVAYNNQFGFNLNDTATYSVIDVRLEGNKGDVMRDNAGKLLKGISFIPKPSSEKLTAVKRNNCGNSYWVITHSMVTNEFYANLLDSNGLHPPVVSATGSVFGTEVGLIGIGLGMADVGYLKASNDGNTLAAAIVTKKKLEIYSFNKATGIVTFKESIALQSDPYGLSFSPNDSLFYVSSGGDELWQFERYAPNIGASRRLTKVLDTNPLTKYNLTYSALQLAPNGKIYAARPEGRLRRANNTEFFTNGWLSVIEQPNKLGMACMLRDSVIKFSGNQTVGAGLPNCVDSEVLPYTPNLRLQASRTCIRDTLRLSMSSWRKPSSIYWRWGDGTSTSGLSSVAHAYTQAGTYTAKLFVTYDGCRLDSVAQEIVILPCDKPAVSLSASVTDTCGYSEVSYSLISNHADTLLWDTNGDGLIDASGATVPVYRSRQAQNFVVRVYAKNAYGADTATVNVSIAPQACEPVLFVPNVFTPNNDTKNDVWRVESAYYQSLSVVVYNRWGQKVFSAGSQDFVWDGSGCPSGVYFYHLQALSDKGQTLSQRGTVSLMR